MEYVSIRRIVPSGRAMRCSRAPRSKKFSSRLPPPRSKITPRLDAFAERPAHGRAHQPRLFLAADHLQLDARLPPDALHQAPVVAHLAGGRGGDRAVGADVRSGPCGRENAGRRARRGNRFVVEQAPRECVVAQPHRGAFVFEDLDVMRRSGARDHQADGVRARVDRCQLDRGGHS